MKDPNVSLGRAQALRRLRCGSPLLEQQSQEVRFPRRKLGQAFLNPPGDDHIPGRSDVPRELEGQSPLGLRDPFFLAAHGVSDVATGAEHESVDLVGILDPPRAKGLENNHHNLLCQIFGRRYIESKMFQPVEAGSVQKAAAELGFARGCVLAPGGNPAGDVRIRQKRRLR